ncbi:hypothetical protein QR680_014885 [Steinernema hermaphroditum]|uniref:Uncharacterized protein n=1 Tax=Steinernema hermaphroditum TaxID=289476 RepID=A0AA39M4M5_9BILA|nr:hypothetical protein QR680_014885 [Steinernema hermaphroditum]
MRNVKTLKYDNTSQRYFCGSTFHTLVNGKWITFSFEVMKEIVINDRPSFAIFTHRDRLYALDNGKLYSLDLSNAGERIELSDGKKKTLTCPVCRKAVELKIDEYLPVNWALKTPFTRMEVTSFPRLEGELEDALLCSVSDDKVILHSKNSQILIYYRQSHGIWRYGCPNGHCQRENDANGKYYECVCNILKYDNASNFYVRGSTFYIEVNGKWITFSFEVMKEIVINDLRSFATGHDASKN